VQRWAIGMVSSMCLEEADALMRTRDHPLRTSRQTLSWAILHGWDIEHLHKYMQSHAPTIWRPMIDISKKRHQTGTEGNPPASQSRRAPEVMDVVCTHVIAALMLFANSARLWDVSGSMPYGSLRLIHHCNPLSCKGSQ